MTQDRTPLPRPTDAELADLVALAERAQARPWAEKNRYIETADGPLMLTARDWQNDKPEHPQNHANREFIALARNLAPALAAEVQELRALREAVVELLRDVDAGAGYIGWMTIERLQKLVSEPPR